MINIINDLPISRLFMRMSADGKISTGQGDLRAFDEDLPAVPGVREDLHHYCEMEQKADLPYMVDEIEKISELLLVS